jgi:hypothetical protein
MVSMSKRPKHPRKEGEDLLSLIERNGWSVEKGTKYFRARCPCGKHQASIYLTPSTDAYFRHILSWFRNKPCWKDKA